MRKKKPIDKHSFDLNVTDNEGILLLVGIRLMNELIESIHIQDQEFCETAIEGLIEQLEKELGSEKTAISDEILEELINSFLPEVHICDIGDNTDYNYPMYSIEEKLPIIERAIEKKRTLEIEYYSMAREDINTRCIKPYLLQKRQEHYVLIAYCQWREDMRLFRVDRIKSLHLTDEVFSIPEDFDQAEYVNEEYI